LTKTHYIYQSHTSHSLFLHFSICEFTLCEKKFLSKTENLETPKPSSSSPMASSSAKQVTGSNDSGMQINTDSGYLLKPKTMAFPVESFEVQIESPVDFASLKRNGMDLESLITV